jgi:hypothetical protein
LLNVPQVCTDLYAQGEQHGVVHAWRALKAPDVCISSVFTTPQASNARRAHHTSNPIPFQTAPGQGRRAQHVQSVEGEHDPGT